MKKERQPRRAQADEVVRLRSIAGQKAWSATLSGLLILSVGFSGCYEYALKDEADSETLTDPMDTGRPSDPADTVTDAGTLNDPTDTGTDTGRPSDPTDTLTQDDKTDKETLPDTVDTDPGCAAGYQGLGCAEACPSTKVVIESCVNPTLNCSAMIDGDHTTATSRQCFLGQDACFPVDFDFSFSERFYVDRVRFMSDWHNKRPRNWELLASDDGVHYTRVVSAASNASPWHCVQGAPCTEAVPMECCPGGVEQDISAVGPYFPKWDDFRFTGAVARYWRFRVHSIDDLGYLELYELELYGNRCLGALCSQTSCDDGICTGKRPAGCTCPDCQPIASCESAFVGAGPGCVPYD